MGLLVPVFVAYLLLCFGIQFFREPREVGPGPLVSSYIFMFAAFLLLWDIRLYPRSMRKLGIISQCIIEFLIASFLFENIMVDFWFPLELVALNISPKLADLVEEMLQSGEWSCDAICEFLRDEKTSFAASYLLSLFFLLTILHATRAIDLRELENGPTAFFRDMIFRVKRYFKKLKRYFGIGLKKKVHIKEVKDRKGALSSSSKTSIDSICPGMSRGGRVQNKSKSNSCSSNKNKKNRKCKRKSPDDLRYSFSDFEMTLKENSRDR